MRKKSRARWCPQGPGSRGGRPAGGSNLEHCLAGGSRWGGDTAAFWTGRVVSDFWREDGSLRNSPGFCSPRLVFSVQQFGGMLL